jgi:pilus assembly protein CpaE
MSWTANRSRRASLAITPAFRSCQPRSTPRSGEPYAAAHREDRLLAQTHDYVVVDTPGTFNELIAATLEMANLILLVTSMDIASIKDTALALEMLRAAAVSEDKVKLTINHSTAANSLSEEDVSRVLEYDVFWRIPHDLSVSSSTQLGQPIVVAKPYARVSRSIIDLAHALGTRRETRFLDRFSGRSLRTLAGRK